jgi:hypothetical protein
MVLVVIEDVMMLALVTTDEARELILGNLS